MTERQKYELLNEFKGFELRRYAVCSVAEVESDASYSDASQGAFGSLFQYISRGNSGSEKIGMTAPVIATTTSGLDSKAWKIAFVMPAMKRFLSQESMKSPLISGWDRVFGLLELDNLGCRL